MHDLPEVFHWRRLDAEITLSGQPTEAQLSQIRDLGVTYIINLGPHTNKGALNNEARTVVELGTTYVYIPVDFEAPTEDDFSKFCEALEGVKGQRTHLHCIYNARVTAFFYRYAQIGLGGSASEAHVRMDGIWRPGGVWARFIGNAEAVDLSNRYEGYDYECAARRDAS